MYVRFGRQAEAEIQTEVTIMQTDPRHLTSPACVSACSTCRGRENNDGGDKSVAWTQYLCDIVCVPRYETAIHYVSAARNPGSLFMPDVMGTARTERVNGGEADGTLRYLPIRKASIFRIGRVRTTNWWADAR